MLREEWLDGVAKTQTAEPLRALLAALDERLSLMPLVGVVKRRDGVPLVVPEREKVVLERALADLNAEAQRAKRTRHRPRAACARCSRPVRGRASGAVRAREGLGRAARTAARSREGAAPGAAADRRAHRALCSRCRPTSTPPPCARPRRDELRAPYLDAAQRDALADAIAACTKP
jgi:cyclohexadienyl dehydratase